MIWFNFIKKWKTISIKFQSTMKIGKFLLEKKYQIRGESNRTPPYSYRHFCKELSSIIDLNSITMSGPAEIVFEGEFDLSSIKLYE